MYGAANFNNLGPILSAPVALVMSIFFRYLTFSYSMNRDVCVFVNFSSQNILSLSKLEIATGSFIFEATDTKNMLNSDKISEGFSII